MIAIKLKQQQQGNQAPPLDITQTGAYKRVLNDQKEFNDSFPPSIKIRFPDPKDIMYFEVDIKPDEQYWQGAMISFTIKVTDEYPIKPPKVLCKKRIFHPNIDLEGKVCLNILRDEWKPISTLKTVIFGLLFLFLSPNPADPLNKDAAEMMLKDMNQFATIVKSTMKGGSYKDVMFDKII